MILYGLGREYMYNGYVGVIELFITIISIIIILQVS